MSDSTIGKLPPEKELHSLLVNIGRQKGANMLMSTIMAEVFANPEEISLEELAKRTGYSLSSVSNAINSLEHTGKIRRVKKPGSRKVFVTFEKNLTKSLVDMTSSAFKIIIDPMSNDLPKIIDALKGLQDDDSLPKEKRVEIRRKIAWYDDYLCQIRMIAKILLEVQEKFKEVNCR